MFELIEEFLLDFQNGYNCTTIHVKIENFNNINKSSQIISGNVSNSENKKATIQNQINSISNLVHSAKVSFQMLAALS